MASTTVAGLVWSTPNTPASEVLARESDVPMNRTVRAPAQPTVPAATVLADRRPAALSFDVSVRGGDSLAAACGGESDSGIADVRRHLRPTNTSPPPASASPSFATGGLFSRLIRLRRPAKKSLSPGVTSVAMTTGWRANSAPASPPRSGRTPFLRHTARRVPCPLDVSLDGQLEKRAPVGLNRSSLLSSTTSQLSSESEAEATAVPIKDSDTTTAAIVTGLRESWHLSLPDPSSSCFLLPPGGLTTDSASVNSTQSLRLTRLLGRSRRPRSGQPETMRDRSQGNNALAAEAVITRPIFQLPMRCRPAAKDATAKASQRFSTPLMAIWSQSPGVGRHHAEPGLGAAESTEHGNELLDVRTKGGKRSLLRSGSEVGQPSALRSRQPSRAASPTIIEVCARVTRFHTIVSSRDLGHHVYFR
ncbi:unnamed protein product [Protopolystoma xenopodis]|uniref:Uncharacterized protein n=1 Tax=Protopolystoma xenopodis TaxID=117903 RepID=A0A448WU88_9PLAT|nr:unnamed protein product [Protopolystoma xenopodis]